MRLTTLNQGNVIKLCMSECLWRWGQSCHRWGSVFPQRKAERQLRSWWTICQRDPQCVCMRSGPKNLSRNYVCLRGGVEETRLEHLVPAKGKGSLRNSFGPLLVAEHEDIWRRNNEGFINQSKHKSHGTEILRSGNLLAWAAGFLFSPGKGHPMDVPLDWDLSWMPVWSLGLCGVVLRPSCWLRHALPALMFGWAVHIKVR